MAVQQQNNIRIYDLAKELKLDNKKVIEDARREGVDVSVPSNSVPAAVAEKIRAKYFPKKALPTAGPRLVKTVKKAESASEVVEAPAPPVEQVKAEPVVVPPTVQSQEQLESVELLPEDPNKAKVRILKPQPAQPIAAEQPEAPVEVQPQVEVEEVPEVITQVSPESEKPLPEPVQPAVKPPTPAVVTPVRPQGTQVRILSPKPGVTMAPPPPKPATLPKVTPLPYKRQADTGRRPQVASGSAAPGVAPDATAPKAPLTTYVPQDTGRGRKRTRRGKRGPGEFGHEEGKHLDVPSHLRGRAPVQQKSKPVFTELRSIKLMEGTTVKDFSEKLELKPKDVVQELFRRGVMATINQTLNQEVAQELGKEFGFDVSFLPFEEMILDTEDTQIIESGDENLVERAPVVTVMGHVDHGKTSLLDAIRQTHVAEGEAGGITQHIGAYSVEVPDPDHPEKTRKIVFLDTPGHEAFTMMRARGAKVTDVVVLVVAADDGVMPQTLEAIDHSKAADVRIIVAINKIDKPEANPDRVKQELATRGLQSEDWGGDTVMVEVSAKKKQNLDALLELIILSSDLLELKANPDRLASGVVLEAKLDRGRGSVATVLVQQGTMRVGDPFIVGEVFGRVRAMFNDRGQAITEAGPATPVEVIGLQGVPHAGDQLQVVKDATQAQNIANQRQMQARQAAIGRTSARSLEQLFADKSAIKELLIILKGDVQGSVEAVRDSLNKLSTERVQIRIIRSGVGAITESDVMLAAASAQDMNRASVIIGFNVRPETRARELAEAESVDIRLHTIIYKVEEEMKNAMLGLMDKTKREIITGHAEVRQVFKVPRIGQIAGCSVTDGVIRRTPARLLRDNVVVYEGRIESLRRVKDDVSEVRQGFECGISLEKFQDIKLGDIIETYTTEEVAPTQL